MRKQQIIAGVCLALVLIVALVTRLQPQDGLLSFRVVGNVAYGNGYTDTDSARVVRNLVNEHPSVTQLILQRMSGTRNADANLKIARDIRNFNLATHLEADSYIASGAVDLFLAGTQRSMDCGAKIGVHSWGLTGADGRFSPETMGSDSRKRIQERFLRDMGLDPAFYVFTRDAAGPNEIYILTAEDIARFGILTEDGCRE
ncbi:hypothetical protein [Fretibacter rubidus]|uniref:hypothetical protein n=1 Tax=Fretibacter rubidus TaxID=570162 RepID=UPI00352B8611